MDSWEPNVVGSVRSCASAQGLKDISAVTAAVETSWSTGQIEGQINRPKIIKRQMYGRVGFELLRARVLPYLPTFAAGPAPSGASKLRKSPFSIGTFEDYCTSGDILKDGSRIRAVTINQMYLISASDFSSALVRRSSEYLSTGSAEIPECIFPYTIHLRPMAGPKSSAL